MKQHNKLEVNNALLM